MGGIVKLMRLTETTRQKDRRGSFGSSLMQLWPSVESPAKLGIGAASVDGMRGPRGGDAAGGSARRWGRTWKETVGRVPGDAACGHQLFDVAIAEAKAKIEPDTMTDDLCWKPMALVWIRG
jgi:hypothetical protein